MRPNANAPFGKITDLAALRPTLDRTLAAVRYFQATAVAVLVITLSLVVTYLFVLPPEIGRGVLTFLAETAVTTPTTPAGYAMKLGAVIPYVMPVFGVLAAGAIANLERPISVIIGLAFLFVLLLTAWLVNAMGDTLSQIPGWFFQLYWLAVPINLTVLALVVYGAISVWHLTAMQRAALRDGFGQSRFLRVLFRLIGMPSYVRHLKGRRWIVTPLFILSSALLASSLYPMLFAGSFANNLVRINRSECTLAGAARFTCFEEAMRQDAFLFPLYMAVGFLIPFGFYLLFRRLARSLSITTLQGLMQSDPRAPVLFLRPFGDDQVALPRAPGFSPFRFIRIGDAPRFLEHQVLEEMTELGPVVAIGDRSAGHVPFGAAREYVPDDGWQDRVGGLIDASKAIVIVLNDTPGVWWEVQTLLAKRCLDRTLFVFPFSDEDKRARLWEGLAEALAPTGPRLPQRSGTAGQVLGLYRAEGQWQVYYTDAPTSTDTLALLRFFGTRLLAPPVHSERSFARYPYSIALVLFLVFAAFFDDLLRLRQGEVALASAPPAGWSTQTVLGLSSGAALDERLFFERAAPDPATGGMVALARRGEASPQVLWFAPDGGLTRTVTMAVPERDTPLAGWEPLVSPIAADWGDDGQLKTAIAIAKDRAARIELRSFSATGAPLAEVRAALIGALTTVDSGVFLPDGSLIVSGQVRLEDGGNGPFLGRLGADGGWQWYYNDMGGRGWANQAALSGAGTIASALQINRQWYVAGWSQAGDLLFSAPAPNGAPFGAAKALVPVGPEGWHVAGTTQATGEPGADTLPVVAALDGEGSYGWVTELPQLAGYYIQGIAHRAGRTYVAASEASMRAARAAVVVLEADGAVVETVDIFASGSRSIRTMSLAEDGAIWVFGTALDLPPDLPPLERMGQAGQPWVMRISETPDP